MNMFVTATIGAIVGAILVLVIILKIAPSMMIIENESIYSYEESIEKIQGNARELGWKIPAVHQLHEAVAPSGYIVDRVAVIELCQPHHAAKILLRDDARLVTSLMPCRISVYETSDGRVIMSRMNSSLVARVFGGIIAEVMSEAGSENEQMLENLIKK